MSKKNGYHLSRKWFDFAFDKKEAKVQHTALYMWCIELNNRLGWKSEFGLPTTDTMEGLSIGNKNTFLSTLKDLVSWGFINVIRESKNQNQARIISVCHSENVTTGATALDTALIRQEVRHSDGTGNGTDTSTVPIDKQINNKPQTKKQQTVLPEVKKLRDDCKKLFLSFYSQLKGTEYYWVAKDSVNLIPLLAKIESKVKEKYADGYTTENVYEGFAVVVASIKDAWILDNLSVPIINSKFNEIFTQIKNGKSTTKDKYAESKFRV